MNNNEMTNHTIKINKIITSILWLNLILMSSVILILGAEAVPMSGLIVTFIAPLVTTILIYKKIAVEVTKVILLTAVLLNLLATSFEPYLFIMYIFISISICSLYLNKRIVIICGIIVNVMLIYFKVFSNAFETGIGNKTQ